MVEQGHFYDQSYNPENIIDSVAVEAGLFVGNLGYYLLEEGLDISYNSCFKRNIKDWHNVGLHMVEQRPIIMLSCGYAERYRRQDLIDKKIEDWDTKPEIDEIENIFTTASNISDKRFDKIKDYELASCLLKSKKGVQCIIKN